MSIVYVSLFKWNLGTGTQFHPSHRKEKASFRHPQLALLLDQALVNIASLARDVHASGIQGHPIPLFSPQR